MTTAFPLFHPHHLEKIETTIEGAWLLTYR